ncbi:MAG: hypothetical protein IT280_00195 [Ignavibacteria bacterium]|nr:hypothetical protein [Ignavibacteria bacterium]
MTYKCDNEFEPIHDIYYFVNYSEDSLFQKIYYVDTLVDGDNPNVHIFNTEEFNKSPKRFMSYFGYRDTVKRLNRYAQIIGLYKNNLFYKSKVVHYNIPK